MSRIDRNGITQYTIGEKITYYENELKKKHNSQARINAINRKLKQLYAAKRKYGVVYMEDDRFFDNPTRDGHNYIITEINENEEIGANRLSHSRNGVLLKSSFDKKTRIQRETLRFDRTGKSLNANDAYQSYLADKFHQDDYQIVDKKRR